MAPVRILVGMLRFALLLLALLTTLPRCTASPAVGPDTPDAGLGAEKIDTSDAALAASEVIQTVSACLNGSDLHTLKAVPQDPTSAAQLCFLECLSTPTTVCRVACISKLGALSGGCNRCFADMVGCVDDHCHDLCVTDSDSAPCDHCVTDSGCDEAYARCSGLRPDISIVTVVNGNSYCTVNPPDSGLATLLEAPGTDLYRACNNAADLAIIEAPEYQSTEILCGEACFAKGKAMTGQCLVEKLTLSPLCALCTGSRLQCHDATCNVACR